MTAGTPSGAPAAQRRPNFADLTRESGLRVRLIHGWRIERSKDGATFRMTNEYGELPPFAPWFEAYEPANEKLRDGAPLGELRDLVMASADPVAGASYMVMLQMLCRRSFLEFPLVEGEREVAVLMPQQEEYVPALGPAPDASDGLDRCAVLRRESGFWLLESPMCAVRLRMTRLEALDDPLVRRALAGAGFLESARKAEGEARREALRHWETFDLMFHSRSRNGWHRDPFGALFPFIDEIEPQPALRPAWPGERTALPRAQEAESQEAFASVMERRRSERVYDENRPISVANLGALLDRCAAVRHVWKVPVNNFLDRSTEFEISRRPYPNGGASYELEIYPVVDRCAGLESGCYHYDAGAHELVRICGRTKEVEQILSEANVATVGQATPQVVLVIAARFARVMWKYKSIAYAVILRNTGALYQTLYLGATDLGLSPCGLGSGNSPLFGKMTGQDPWIEGSVGEFILGGPPARE